MYFPNIKGRMNILYSQFYNTDHRIINDRMENSMKGRGIRYNLRRCGGCARAVPARLPPSLYSYIGWLQNVRFHNFAKFSQMFYYSLFIIIIYYFNYQNQRKISRNTKLKNLRKFHEITKTKILQPPYSNTICPVCYSPSPPVCKKILQCSAAMLL